MQMQMQVAVDMIERQAGGAEFFKLRVNFGPELLLEAALEKIAKTGCDGIFRKFTARVDEAGNFFRRQCGAPAQQRQMQADAEFGILLKIP